MAVAFSIVRTIPCCGETISALSNHVKLCWPPLIVVILWIGRNSVIYFVGIEVSVAMMSCATRTCADI